MGGDKECAWVVTATPIGPLLLAATDEGLVNVVFHADEKSSARALARLATGLGVRPVRAQGDAVLERAAAELGAYFEGDLREFRVPLDWSLTSGFTGRVLRELAASVPFGSVVTYRELAMGSGGGRIGDPGAARAVGAAMGANPLPVIVPCHRVVAADGGLGGFGGGLETKRALLSLEGILPQPLF